MVDNYILLECFMRLRHLIGSDRAEELVDFAARDLGVHRVRHPTEKVWEVMCEQNVHHAVLGLIVLYVVQEILSRRAHEQTDALLVSAQGAHHCRKFGHSEVVGPGKNSAFG